MKQYSLFAVLSISMVVFALAFVKKENDRPDKHLEIVLRNIGHQVLLRSKDSTSRVLPVKAVNENTFRISFGHSFGFIPDTLMNVVHQQLAKTDRADEYTVSVNDCYKSQIVFAYEVDKARGDLKPCRGRELKPGCYVIEISFAAKGSFNRNWLLLTFIPIAIAGLYFGRKRSKVPASAEPGEEKSSDSPSTSVEPVPVTAGHKTFGNFVFDESKGILTLNGDAIELSVKEAKALSILASNLNQAVGRDVLMKDIWEDDGIVVITRNVDVLISKLRKKLSADPSLKIVNVHGKGYKMMV